MRTFASPLLILLAAMIAVPHGLAQTRPVVGEVAGKVTLQGNEPAIGATVMLAGTRYGTSVSTEGTYVIRDVPPGIYMVVARLVGFRPAELAGVVVEPGKSTEVALAMSPADIELNPVVVTRSRQREAEDVRPSVTSLTPRESKILPGAAEDVLRSLQAVPGVTSVSDFSSELVVRGSGPDQNLIMIDGYEVLNPYRLYGFVSMFNPETVSDISLQTGGFGAQYGDRLSAVLDVRNRDGRQDAIVGGKLNLSLTNMNAILEGGLGYSGASYLVSVRRTYYDLILGPVLRSAKLVQGDVALPNFRDIQARVTLPLGGAHDLIVNAITSRDGVDLATGSERERPDSVSVIDRSFNTLTGVSWNYHPSKDLLLQTSVSWYRNEGSGAFDGTLVDPSQNSGDLQRKDTTGLRFFTLAVNYGYVFQKVSGSQRLLWNLPGHSLEAGYGVDLLRTDFSQYLEFDPVFVEFLRSRGQIVPTSLDQSLRYKRYNVYLQDRIAIGDRLFVQPGLRLDVYPVLRSATALAPRLNVSYRLDDLSTFRAGFGVYYQSPGYEKLNFRSRIQFTREAFAALDPERAQHFILGYDRMLSPEWQFKTEAYYKSLERIIVPERLAGSRWYSAPTGGSPTAPSGWSTPVRVQSDSVTPVPVNDASGSAYGIEVMVQKIRSLPGDRFTGWISYALSKAERERGGTRTPFLFDQRHAANIVGNYRFAEKWDLGVRFTLRSGRPYTMATGVQPRVVVVSVSGTEQAVVQVDSRGRAILDPVYEIDTYSGRLALYHSLDLRVTTYPSWFGLDWAVYLDVQNVYNHANQQQIGYYIDPAGALQQRVINGIPIFPSLGFSVVF